MTIKIADDYVALSKRLSELEMERAKQLTEKVNAPEDKNVWPYQWHGGYTPPDYDGA